MAQTVAVRGDTGLLMASGPPFDSPKVMDSTKNCKVMMFSNKGSHLAWSDGKTVTILDLSSNAKAEIDAQRTHAMQWSPQDNFLATWEIFAVRDGKQEPNMKLWSQSGQLKASFIQRKNEGWHPRWSPKEDLVAIRSMNNEVFFYKPDQGFDSPEKKLSLAKMESFSVSHSGLHVVAFIPGQKGAPGFAKLFGYPNFHPEKDVIANKSFMLADKMEAKWSSDSKAVILHMQSEVDKTGASYYGKSQLHFMDVFGETSMVSLAKEGPIYHVEWAPKGGNFVVVYGFMPAKATMFNKKCEKVFDFGTGPRNVAMFNSLSGNLLLLGGFGNLRGNIEIWNVEAKTCVAKFEAPDTTNIKWSPDGQHLLTSTCAPRLRMSNGYKVWHYTSTLLHETLYKEPTAVLPGEELWEAMWRPDPEASGKVFKVLDKPILGGIKPQQPQASKQAYVPPAARGKTTSRPIVGIGSKLHDEDELPENLKNKADNNELLSKSAAKNKKRREAAKKKKDEEEAANTKAVSGSEKAVTSTGDPEKDKKIRKLNDKLGQIVKLKEQVKAGKQLEANQIEKIKKESEILAELKALTV